MPGPVSFEWGAFRDLGGDRRRSFGAAGPILFTSVDALAHRFGVDGGDEFTRFAPLVHRMDGIYLEVQRKRAEQTKGELSTSRM